jgi:hypothetical protein
MFLAGLYAGQLHMTNVTKQPTHHTRLPRPLLVAMEQARVLQLQQLLLLPRQQCRTC